MSWLKTWRKRRACFHHDRRTGESWINDWIVDSGRKHFLCRERGRCWT